MQQAPRTSPYNSMQHNMTSEVHFQTAIRISDDYKGLKTSTFDVPK